jgi:PPOX class probable F420-dependent enzyme
LKELQVRAGQAGPVHMELGSGELVAFVRQRGRAVLATRGPDGAPQAALIGVAATDQGEIVFDTSRSSRKFANITADPRVALVVGLDDEVTVQAEGFADLPAGEELRRCVDAYFAQYPDGRDRAADPDIVHFRVRLAWLRYGDYRPDSFTIEESPVPPPAA